MNSRHTKLDREMTFVEILSAAERRVRCGEIPEPDNHSLDFACAVVALTADLVESEERENRLRQLLTELDLGGGLGLDVQQRIRKALLT